MKSIVSIAALALALTVGASANAASSFTDGNFSSNTGVGQIDYNTTITGWSANGGYNFLFQVGTLDTTGANGVYGNVSLWGANNGGLNTISAPPLGGNWVVALDGDFGTEPLTQSISGLTVGKSYKVTFDYGFAQQYGFNGATMQDLTVALGSQSFTTQEITLPSHGFTGWTADTLTFTATSATETLSFLAYGNVQVPPFALVSGVSMTAVPELSTWAMMLAGFGGLGLVAHLRRRSIAAA